MRVAAAVVSLLLLSGLSGLARADRVSLLGEVRLATVGLVGSPAQFGPNDPMSSRKPCGDAPRGDVGGTASATGVLVLRAPSYRYQLGVAVGTYGYLCTESLNRPVGGIDFRGEHRFTERTLLRSSARLQIDAFDRTFDIRLGTVDPGAPAQEKPATVAGTPYLTGAAALELEHRLLNDSGLRAGVDLQTLQIFAPTTQLSRFTSLGPMVAAAASLSPFRDTPRARFELPLQYRVSHYYPATVAPEVPLRRVPPAQDMSARFSYERRFSQLLTLHVEGGLAAAFQPNLCVQSTQLIARKSCSIDETAPGIRGKRGAPALEVPLGNKATGTFVGEVSLSYRERRRVLDLVLSRTYEPNAYAAALDLVNRLALNVKDRHSDDLSFAAGLQLAHFGHSSPSRVTPDEGVQVGSALVSPQNRTMVMLQASLGADWILRSSVAVFGQLDFQYFGIRGEPVADRDAAGNVLSARQVGAFPLGSADPLQSVWRLGLTLGVRLFTRPPEREPDVLQTGRAVP